ncbi:MAG: tetratricopeptide repeat protein [Bryobacterales bacterium]|nr:tetratricopeptide repeat protein [Bryobacterales bacterium]
MLPALSRLFLAGTMALGAAIAQPGRGPGPQTEWQRRAQPLLREGKLEEALVIYREELKTSPDSLQANISAGTVLDLMGKAAEARPYFQKAIDVAPDARAKANAQRAMAMSFAFDGDCRNTVKYEQMVSGYWKTRESAEPGNAFYQQGEMANEAARVCIESGDFDAAEKWYRAGREAGLKEPGIAAGRKALWEFRTEHALARLAARRGNKAAAARHVAAAKAALERIEAADPNLYRQQSPFFPYLTGYVAYYSGDYHAALAGFQKANTNDPFIQCLLGMTYEKLGDKDKALEEYRKAATVTSHNPVAAFAKPFTRKKLAQLAARP